MREADATSMSAAPGRPRRLGPRGALGIAAVSLRAAWAAETSHRASFLIKVAIMVINDLTWIAFWVLLYSHKRSIRGWRLHDILVIYAVLAVSIGVGAGLFNGVRRMSRTIRSGGLDPLLCQPAPVLLRLLFQRVEPTLMGDIVFGSALFLATGHDSPAQIGRFVLVSAMAAAMITSFLVITESIAFWTASGGEIANVAFGALAVLGTYPANVYSGFGKIVVFTIVPAAIITTVPARFILHAGLGSLGAVAAGCTLMVLLAVTVFGAGLRHYMRGSMG